MGSLSGKVAAVTGAGTGLGQAIANALAAEGADIAVLELDRDAGDEAALELRGHGVRAGVYQTDVSSSDQVDAAVAGLVRDLGRLDVFVNNAGISRTGPHTHKVSDKDWFDSIAVMQTGVFFGMRAAATVMLDQGAGGSIINIASVRGFSPNVGRITYCAPKAAVIMMTKVAAGEWAPHGIRVNAIAPGAERTPMWDADVARGEIDEDRYVAAIPAGRLGNPSEVGTLAAFLASDASAYINGSCMVIDGALSCVTEV